MIRPIQLIIFFLLLTVMIVYFKRLRSKLLDRMIVLIIGSLGLLMALVPEWSNHVAHMIGVGRGVDLVIYLSIIGLAFLWIGIYTRIRDLETRQTWLVRRLAIEQARFPAPHTLGQTGRQTEDSQPEQANEEHQNPCTSV
jgi:hypothetical protein